MPLRPLVSLSLLVLFACYCRATMTHAAEAPAETPSAKTPANKTAGELPPDLGTRKAGKDWPAFLGPTADSKSSEHGILTKWSPKARRSFGSIAWAPATACPPSAAVGCSSFRDSAGRRGSNA